MLDCFDEDFWKMTGGFLFIISIGVVGLLCLDYLDRDQAAWPSIVSFFEQTF